MAAKGMPGAVKNRVYKAAGCAKPSTGKGRNATVSCFAEGLANATTGKIVTQDDGPLGTSLSPTQLRAAYNLPANPVSGGKTVAIVDSGGYARALDDLNIWRNAYGLGAMAPGQFTKLDQRGGTNYPAEDPNWATETSLDLDAVSAICPDCKIVLVESDDAGLDNMGIATATAAAQPGVVAISNSYGVIGEVNDPYQLTLDHYYDHPGIAVLAATGDVAHVTNWPATTGNVLAVGGTYLAQDASSPRGWDESAWGRTVTQDGVTQFEGGGSGCSVLEAQPSYQNGLDTACPTTKAIADISADADPASGLSTYNVDQGGWAQWGGTSLATPLLAGMYALAGTPIPGTYPVTYPYRDPSALNDITTGSNDPNCDGDITCSTGTGYDGPTGLGTPNGLSSLTEGPFGYVKATVKDDHGSPIKGATVTITSESGIVSKGTTDATGTITVAGAVGADTVQVRAYGYNDDSATVQVTDGATATQSFALVQQVISTVSGVVKDGSGQGWPIYAKITIDGFPGQPVYSNPTTGAYSVDLPVGTTYTIHATPVDLTGYASYSKTLDLTSATADPTSGQDLDLTVDDSCTTAGYHWVTTAGQGTDFTGWTGTTAPADSGWTVVDNLDGIDPSSGPNYGAPHTTWRFDDPKSRGNQTGGSGTFAQVDSDYDGQGVWQDTSLVSPLVDLTGVTDPHLDFDTHEQPYWDATESVDLSTDGGTTWTNVWYRDGNGFSGTSGNVDIDVPQAAGVADAQFRFHSTANWSTYWQIDDVLLGTRVCSPIAGGGLLTGQVTDKNTDLGVTNASVTIGDSLAAVTEATPDDANLTDGFYSVYLPDATAPLTVSAARGTYVGASATVTPKVGGSVAQDLVLTSGQLSVSSPTVTKTLEYGQSTTVAETVSNTGSAPVQVRLGTEDAGFTPSATSTVKGAGTPAIRTPLPAGVRPDQSLLSNAKALAAASSSPSLADASDTPWTPIANLPTAIAGAGAFDQAAATVGGKVYEFAGTQGSDWTNEAATQNSYVYDPSALTWSPIAPYPVAVEAPNAETIGGQIYVFGGWQTDPLGNTAPIGNVYRYDPARNAYDPLASMPIPTVGSGHAVIDGKLYVVGGCTADCQPATTAVQVYDPSTNAWSTVSHYPFALGFGSCGAIDDQLYCAGGADENTYTGAINGTDVIYAYNEAKGSWARKARMPYTVMGAFSTVHGGRLQVIDGFSSDANGVAVNTAVSYDPITNSWDTMDNTPEALFRGATACGAYTLGGWTWGDDPHTSAYYLPGDGCDSEGADWLTSSAADGSSTVTLAPGATTTVNVAIDSLATGQPGSYAGRVQLTSDTPYNAPAVDVALTVTAPQSWGKLKGTVTDASGTPLGGATVQVCGNYTGTACGDPSWTLHTDAAGHYQLWADVNFGSFLVTATSGGLPTGTKVVTLSHAQDTVADFALAPAAAKSTALIGLTLSAPSVKSTAQEKATAVVSAEGGATGIVRFTVTGPGTSWTGQGTLVNGAVTVTLPKLAKGGAYAVRAVYAGSDTVQTVSSAKVPFTVVGPPAVQVSLSAKSVTVKAHAKATVTVSGGATGTVTVTIKGKGKTFTVSGTIVGGKVVLTLPKLAKAGTYTVQAVYAGSTTTPGSSSAVAQLKVVKKKH